MPRTLLVLGGSQGARRLNDLAMEAVPLLFAGMNNLSVIHQTGVRDEKRVREFYCARALTVDVRPFIENMGAVYGACDLCLSRAGALSVSELAASGVPAVFIPYPHAMNHQRRNARWAEERGAALVLEQEQTHPHQLAGQLRHLLTAPAILQRMARAARAAGVRDAAERIALRELTLMEGRP